MLESIKNNISNLFKTAPQGFGIQSDGSFESRELDDIRIYKTGGTWGNAINFMKWKEGNTKQRVYGFKSWPFKKPREGDILIAEMESGNKAIFGLDNIDVQSNPDDMFFADAHFLGYKDKLEWAKNLHARN